MTALMCACVRAHMCVHACVVHRVTLVRANMRAYLYACVHAWIACVLVSFIKAASCPTSDDDNDDRRDDGRTKVRIVKL